MVQEELLSSRTSAHWLPYGHDAGERSLHLEKGTMFLDLKFNSKNGQAM